MIGRLSINLRGVTVHRNGRPKEAPRPMDVGLVFQLVNPVNGQVLGMDSFLFRAEEGTSLTASAFVPGIGEDEGVPVFREPMEAPDAVLLEVHYVVYYQNDLGPIVGGAVEKLIDLALERIPVVGSLLGPHLHFKVEGRIAEEYGRQSLLVGLEPGPEPWTVALELVASEEIRGFYLAAATGRTVPKPRAALFIEKGSRAATVVLDVARTPPPVKGKKPKRAAARPRKAPLLKKGR